MSTATPATVSPPSPSHAEASASHPRGLYILFATEMWERFSYYGMRALLVLYLVQYLKWKPSEASSTYKWYTSLVYLTPLLGGFLSDKYLGLRRAITIGGVLMAIGHFLMAFEPLPFFYSALAFLILGNGFFKPNISTMVGKMYSANDPRRDGAFTIFYMGINLGAFLAPLVCGYLGDSFGYHYGFAAAGVGMLLGLGVFLWGQKRIQADIDLATASSGEPVATKAADVPPAEEPGENLPRAGGVAQVIATALSPALMALAVITPAWYGLQISQGAASFKDAIMPTAFGLVFGWMGVTLRKIRGQYYDKSSVIFLLFAFSVLFWMAFEQAGNALNLWAEFNTDRHLGSFEYPAAWFQSLNPLLIFTLAPVFAAAWQLLERRGNGVSTAAKMLWGLVFMALSFAAMTFGAIAEERTETAAPLAALPAGVTPNAKGELRHASIESALGGGQLRYEGSQLKMKGVLAQFAKQEALEVAVDEKFNKAIKTVKGGSGDATSDKPLALAFDSVPEGYAFPLPVMSAQDVEAANKAAAAKDASEAAKALAARAAISVRGWDAATRTVTLGKALSTDQQLALIEAAAPAEWKAALNDVEKRSEAARVSGFWLFLSYFLATLGELCVSPVGLSMVTKLSPARYGSLFMGVWLLSSSVAQYVGGALGELWGKVPPTEYFNIFVLTSVVGSVLLAVLVNPLKKLMHDVK